MVKAAGLNVDAEGPSQVELCLSHPNVKMIVNALGPPPQYVLDRAHERGVLVGALAGATQHAERQVAMGVDVVVAQGTEAGGHCGEISTMVLVPQIVDAVGDRVPVLAAGGIADGRQMAAAMALGAQGVWCGSIWLLTEEADMYPEVTENLLEATSRDFVRSRAMTGKPARQLRTRWTEAWEQDDAPKPLPMPLQGLLYAEAAGRFSRVHSKEFGGNPAGQILGSVDKVRPARTDGARHGRGLDRHHGLAQRPHGRRLTPPDPRSRPRPPPPQILELVGTGRTPQPRFPTSWRGRVRGWWPSSR